MISQFINIFLSLFFLSLSTWNKKSFREAPVAAEPAVTKEIDESEITPVVPSTTSEEEETGAGDAPKSEEAVDSSSAEVPVVEEPVANGNGEVEKEAESKEPETNGKFLINVWQIFINEEAAAVT